jgi:aminoglycoside 6'-N-acetyltransferase
VLPTLSAGALTLRPLDAPTAERLADVVAAPGVREWWGPVSEPGELRDELLNEGRAFAIEIDGELAGWLGFEEENEPGYRHAGLDIVLAPPFQDQGFGPAALRLAATWLTGERGHHRLTIDPARNNARAIAAYRKVGFRPVGVMRRYERGADGGWHDNLLMDVLAEELTEAGSGGA